MYEFALSAALTDSVLEAALLCPCTVTKPLPVDLGEVPIAQKKTMVYSLLPSIPCMAASWGIGI